MKAIEIVWTILLFMALASLVAAEVPRMMNYQGRLTDDGGSPLDTVVSMTFTIYDDSTGGNPIWSETHDSVDVSEGLFDVILGKAVPVELFMPDSLPATLFYLECSIGGDPGITPRTMLTSVPYALAACQSDTATFALTAGAPGESPWTRVGSSVRLVNPTDTVVIGDSESQDVGRLELFGNASIIGDVEGISRPSGGVRWALDHYGPEPDNEWISGISFQADSLGAQILVYDSTPICEQAPGLDTSTFTVISFKKGPDGARMGMFCGEGNLNSYDYSNWMHHGGIDEEFMYDATGFDPQTAYHIHIDSVVSHTTMTAPGDSSKKIIQTCNEDQASITLESYPVEMGGFDFLINAAATPDYAELSVNGTEITDPSYGFPTYFLLVDSGTATHSLTAPGDSTKRIVQTCTAEQASITISDYIYEMGGFDFLISSVCTPDSATHRTEARDDGGSIVQTCTNDKTLLYLGRVHSLGDSLIYQVVADSSGVCEQTMTAADDTIPAVILRIDETASMLSLRAPGDGQPSVKIQASGEYSSISVYSPDTLPYIEPDPMYTTRVDSNGVLTEWRMSTATDPDTGQSFYFVHGGPTEGTVGMVAPGNFLVFDSTLTDTLASIKGDGTVSCTGFEMDNGASAGYVLTSDASGNGTWQPGGGGSDGDWTISGNDIYSAVSGNVGVGITTPIHKLDVGGCAGFNDTLYHNGDQNTYLMFTSDQVDIVAGGLQMITADETTQDIVVINEGSADVDFRVESNTEADALFVQGSDGRVGLGTSSPSSRLHVSGTAGENGLHVIGHSAFGANSSPDFTSVLEIVEDFDTTSVRWGAYIDVDNPGGGTYGLDVRAEAETANRRGISASAKANTPYVATGNSYGVISYARDGGTAYGLYGSATRATTGYGVYGTASDNTTSYAGYFSGNTHVTGVFTASSKDFKIDHPLDPENKYLYHSCVESPDMMNVYNGNVTTDGEGFAEVTLPDYFSALNRDFRYQLTVIGEFAQAIIGEEIRDNRFVIRTDKPDVKVSWQVTGIRKDAYAEANRTVVEVEKTDDERGKYLHPEVFGHASELGIDYQNQAVIENETDSK